MGGQVSSDGGMDLHTAAHEAAHVVQQRGGVQLKGNVGQVGDRYEAHADAVADLVVAGKSSEGLLDTMAGTGGASASAVQCKPEDAKKKDPALGGAELEVGGKDGDAAVGLSEDGESLVGQVGKGLSYTIAKNIWGPIYIAGSIGAKIVGAISVGKETGGAIKVSCGAELRLGVGVGQMQGSTGVEIGAGGELKGQLEVVPVGIAHDAQTGWKFDAFTGVISIGINGYVMAQVNGVGPKLTIPARKYDLYMLTGGSYANGQLS
jgi:hypothetical protein